MSKLKDDICHSCLSWPCRCSLEIIGDYHRGLIMKVKIEIELDLWLRYKKSPEKYKEALMQELLAKLEGALNEKKK
jgi:hypothetical protein